MTKRERIRRVGILCCHFLRNVAVYKSGWRDRKTLRIRDEFWKNVNSNSLDIAILEWCKLFGDRASKHRWSRVVREADHASFKVGLLKALRMTDAEYETYTKKMRHYRDKFVSHLDDELTMHIPILRPARQAVAYLYEYLRLTDPEGREAFKGQVPVKQFYRMNRAIGLTEHKRRMDQL